MKIISHSLIETEYIANAYAKTLTPGSVILLSGEMGAGKTAFTKALCKALGIATEVTSPTYAYMNDYEGKVYHFDFYRLSSGEDAEALGLTDYFYMDGICLLEWHENVAEVVPDFAEKIVIEKRGETEREFIFEKEFSL